MHGLPCWWAGPFRASEPRAQRLRRYSARRLFGPYVRTDRIEAAVTWKSLDSNGGRNDPHCQRPSGDWLFFTYRAHASVIESLGISRPPCRAGYS